VDLRQPLLSLSLSMLARSLASLTSLASLASLASLTLPASLAEQQHQ